MKLKTLFMRRITGAFAKAKSLVGEYFPVMKKKKNKKQNKLFFSSFRLHYNWCSSHVMPLARECSEQNHMGDSDELSNYLEWLEENSTLQQSRCNEIDELADLFIANCHEKFRLEKLESYRRFQEMMATSV